MYGDKIRTIRELRGLSQENVAAQLGIAQNTYSKIETNQTKLSTDTLTKLAEIFEVTPMDIISNQPAIVNFQPNHGTQGIGHIEHFYAFQKDLFDKIIATKDEEISRLNTIIEKLLTKK